MTIEPLADDLMTGVVEIADYLGTTRRRTFYLVEKGHIPAFKIGGRWCCRKSSLLAHMGQLEASAGFESRKSERVDPPKAA